MEKSYAEYLFKKTIKDYNLIAKDYSRTREFIWDIEPLSQYVFTGEKILDLGCGNGRLLKVLKDKRIDYIGVDSSEKLIEIAKKKYPPQPLKDKKEIFLPTVKFQVADSLNLPFSNNYFDKVFSIRTFHHIPSKEFRLQFIKEIRRVLKPGGLLILTVWNVWGSKDKTNLLRLIESTFLKIIGRSKLDFGDALIPWGKKILRYYHFFTKSGLKKIAKEGGLKIEEIWTSLGPSQYSDICLVAEK
ncbi:MAG: class I SAM-dependent methyltransferase [Patescibacteria group bacterium]|nr:class I SAM-dependent methyltransferase [Patescibacteria group bacterium]